MVIQFTDAYIHDYALWGMDALISIYIVYTFLDGCYQTT